MTNTQRIVKLTGLPVSEEMQDVLTRLKNKDAVSAEEIGSTPEIKAARDKVKEIKLTTPAIYLSASNRKDIKKSVYEKMMQIGSFNGVDENGKSVYNGEIEQGSRLDIIMGLPASGKSSTVANVISQEFHSRLIDNDEAKKEIPEFHEGWGSDIVHKESRQISDEVFQDVLKNHENIVLPKIGGSANDLTDTYIQAAKEQGYTVNVHYVELDRNVALGRMLNRFIDQGRFLDPRLIEDCAPANGTNKVEQTYETLKESSLVDGYSKWNNNVEKGQKPILVEYSNSLTGDFIKNAITDKSVDTNANQTPAPEPAVNPQPLPKLMSLDEKAAKTLTDYGTEAVKEIKNNEASDENTDDITKK